MNASDVMISKPGRTYEHRSRGCEHPARPSACVHRMRDENIEFFSERGISLRAGNVKDAVHCAWNLIDDKSLADSMREMQRKYIAPDAADRIVSKVISYV